MDDLAIKVDRVSKTFKLPHEKHSSVKSLFVNLFRGRTTYERQQVLKNVSLEINKGDFFGIVGRNGSGKSTLLKLLAGVYVPSKGHVHVNGKLTPFIELGVGFNPELTGRDNVYLNGALLGFSSKEIERMYDDIVDFAEIQKFMDQKLKNYSSGMQVRLAFSIAIRARSDILLLDEVLAVGDAAFQQKCFNYFEDLKRRKQTVVFVSHDMAAVKRFCTKAAYISNGVMEEIGTPSAIAQLYVNENFGEVSGIDTGSHESELPVAVEIELEQNAHVQLGDPIKVKMMLTSKENREIVIATSLLREGVYVGGFNTKKYKHAFKLKKGKNVFRAAIGSTSLSAGQYTVGCGVYEKTNLTPLGLDLNGPKVNIISDADYKDGLSNIDGEITSTNTGQT